MREGPFERALTSKLGDACLRQSSRSLPAGVAC